MLRASGATSAPRLPLLQRMGTELPNRITSSGDEGLNAMNTLSYVEPQRPSTIPGRETDARLAPGAAVLVVIDVQNDFCHPEGLSAQLGKDVSRVPAATDRLVALVEGSRAAGAPVLFVRTTHDENTDSPAWRQRRGMRDSPTACRTGTWGAEYFRCFPQEQDRVVTKHRYSAFTSPEFQSALEALGRDSLLFTGIVTSVCVESTLREAVSRDYLVTLVEDCCIDYHEAAHEATVRAVDNSFGLVRTSDEILSYWS